MNKEENQEPNRKSQMLNEEIKEVYDKYQMTEAEFELMYKQAELLTFSGVKPSKERPTAILTGRTTGSRKNRNCIENEARIHAKRHGHSFI